MDNATLWWMAVGLLVLAELATGTFYLLVLAVAAGIGALAAHAGLTLSTQLVLSAVAGLAGTALWYRARRRAEQAQPAAQDPNALLDIGELVEVGAWDDHGRSTVQYRGSTWVARHAGPAPAQAGTHRIVALHGNQLELHPV